MQESLYHNKVSYSDELEGRYEFLRTPNKYGYATFNFTPFDRFNFVANIVHTGKMVLVHMAGSPEQIEDEYFTSEVFNVIALKATYIHKFKKVGVKLEYSIGIKNLTNAYQNNFDTLKNRDSNFIYGPVTPRTVWFGFKLGTI